MEIQSPSEIVILVTLLSGAISILSQLLQYIFPKRKTMGEDITDLSTALNNITNSYDKLLDSISKRLVELEKSLKEKTIRVTELEKEILLINARRKYCEERIIDLERRINGSIQEISRGKNSEK